MKILLFILILFIAATSTLSGILMITDPNGGLLKLELALLSGTPFKNFLIPGILLSIVGGVNLIALFYNIQKHPRRYNWAITGGFLISAWIIVQMILITVLYWLQFIYLGVGLLIILIAYQLKGKWAV